MQILDEVGQERENKFWRLFWNSSLCEKEESDARLFILPTIPFYSSFTTMKHSSKLRMRGWEEIQCHVSAIASDVDFPKCLALLIMFDSLRCTMASLNCLILHNLRVTSCFPVYINLNWCFQERGWRYTSKMQLKWRVCFVFFIFKIVAYGYMKLIFGQFLCIYLFFFSHEHPCR